MLRANARPETVHWRCESRMISTGLLPHISPVVDENALTSNGRRPLSLGFKIALIT